MKVLFLMFSFPDMNKSFNMFTTIVQEFHNNGHEIFVIAPQTKDEETKLTLEAEINVLRVKTLPIKNVPNYLKGLANIFLPYQFEKALKRYLPHQHFDLIVSPTPPITLVSLASKLKRKFNAKFYLILRDIFPQNAVDLGFMKKGGLIHYFFRKKEIKLYHEADKIGCMSIANIEYVKKHNPSIDSSKLHVLNNYQLLYNDYGKDKSELRKKYGLENKFVVVFGGNMGKPQQLENVIRLAQNCQKYNDVIFFLLGEGNAMNSLEKEINELGIKNIIISKTISKQEYQDLISTCDLGLISLHKNFTIPNIPSKSLDYFNVGLPVLASIDSATDFGKILDEANAGLWSIAGNHEDFANNFDTLYKNTSLRKQMGKNGRIYFENNWIPSIAYQTIINSLN